MVQSRGGIDLPNPDVVQIQTNGTSMSVTTTQKPKYVVHYLYRTGSYAEAMYAIYDVQNETAHRWGYYNGYYDDDAYPFSNLTNITDTGFTLTNMPSGGTYCYNTLLVYY